MGFLWECLKLICLKFWPSQNVMGVFYHFWAYRLSFTFNLEKILFQDHLF